MTDPNHVALRDFLGKASPSARFKSILLVMKTRVAVSLLLAATLTVMAAAQKKPAAGKPAPEKAAAEKSAEKPAPKEPAPETKDPLFFVKTAANVAGNVQTQSLDGYLGIYVDDKNWSDGLKDSDLGSFLKVKEAQPGRSAAFLFSGSKDSAICVYFDGDTPFGVAAVKAGPSGQIQAADVPAAYKTVSKEMLIKGSAELDFHSSDINTDEGTPLPAFLVSSTEKPKN